MYRFNNDYSKGAHPLVLAELEKVNDKAFGGYGIDTCCRQASKLIRERLKSKDSDVHFLVGGTQTNFVAIAAALKPYEGVIAAESGHINVHECGAVESCGIKILGLPHKDGKISAKQIADVAQGYKDSTVPEHVTVPRMVYISFPTEYGTIYSKKELSDIHKTCRKYGLYLFIDGARLSYGLAAKGCDVKFEDFAKLCDEFYIGGTKCGAMMGEALVINNKKLQPHFRNMMKQNGAILAKGWLLGAQYSALFKDDLYFKIAEKADRQADRLRRAFKAKGIKEYIPNTTNQIFVILNDKTAKELAKDFVFEFEGKYDKNHTIVRFCTAWYTKDEEVEALISAII